MIRFLFQRGAAAVGNRLLGSTAKAGGATLVSRLVPCYLFVYQGTHESTETLPFLF
jgi:hypothetical protein